MKNENGNENTVAVLAMPNKPDETNGSAREEMGHLPKEIEKAHIICFAEGGNIWDSGGWKSFWKFVGQIEGQSARILLDIEWSMYVCAFVQVRRTHWNSRDSNEIKVYWPCHKQNARMHLTHRTESLDLKIGEIVVKKTLYIIARCYHWNAILYEEYDWSYGIGLGNFSG